MTISKFIKKNKKTNNNNKQPQHVIGYAQLMTVTQNLNYFTGFLIHTTYRHTACGSVTCFQEFFCQRFTLVMFFHLVQTQDCTSRQIRFTLIRGTYQECRLVKWYYCPCIVVCFLLHTCTLICDEAGKFKSNMIDKTRSII